jgi:rare lipoprotein A
MHEYRIHLVFLLVAGFILAGCSGSYPRFTSRDATALNTRDLSAHELHGVASYYAEEFNGRKTSNGEVYDMNGLTAAHRTLPFNTVVRVTSRETGRSVVVRINDRGPFKGDRVIDLSLAAARKIGLLLNGTASVDVEIVEWGKTD